MFFRGNRHDISANELAWKGTLNDKVTILKFRPTIYGLGSFKIIITITRTDVYRFTLGATMPIALPLLCVRQTVLRMHKFLIYSTLA